MNLLFDLETFDAPAQRHSPTSVAAAESVQPHLSRQRRIVLDYLASCGDEGATDEQIIDAVNLGPNTPRPRRIELVRAGLVRDSGRTRATRSGRQATVWVSTLPPRPPVVERSRA